MSILSSKILVDNALKEIKTINTDEAIKLVEDNKCNLIDLREEGELNNNGSVEKSIHIPRGLLEFSLNSNSPLIKNNVLNIDKEIVLFCAAGGRSALAAKTLNDMGFKNVSHIEGGFSAMEQEGFKVKK